MQGGFDVAMRGGQVLVGWSDTVCHLQVKKGTILGNSIIWSGKEDFGNTVGSFGEYWGNTVSVAIGYDDSLWISEGLLEYSDALIHVFVMKCQPDNWPAFTGIGDYVAMNQGGNAAYILLPSSNGDISIIESGYAQNSQYNGYIRAFHYWSSSNSWSYTAPTDIGLYIGSSPNYIVNSLSAVSSYDGTVHIAFIGSAQSLRYISASAVGTFSS
jgi:hypothetical protein